MLIPEPAPWMTRPSTCQSPWVCRCTKGCIENACVCISEVVIARQLETSCKGILRSRTIFSVVHPDVDVLFRADIGCQNLFLSLTL